MTKDDIIDLVALKHQKTDATTRDFLGKAFDRRHEMIWRMHPWNETLALETLSWPPTEVTMNTSPSVTTTDPYNTAGSGGPVDAHFDNTHPTLTNPGSGTEEGVEVNASVDTVSKIIVLTPVNGYTVGRRYIFEWATSVSGPWTAAYTTVYSIPFFFSFAYALPGGSFDFHRYYRIREEYISTQVSFPVVSGGSYSIQQKLSGGSFTEVASYSASAAGTGSVTVENAASDTITDWQVEQTALGDGETVTMSSTFDFPISVHYDEAEVIPGSFPHIFAYNPGLLDDIGQPARFIVLPKSGGAPRFRLIRKPNTQKTMVVLGKLLPSVIGDTDSPVLPGEDNALLAYLEGDLLERMRQFTKAQVKLQEAAAHVQIMRDQELNQGGKILQIVPDVSMEIDPDF